jgi:hypothetical protein
MTTRDEHLTEADERLLRQFMERVHADAPEATPQLPDARVLWLAAQLVRRWEAERRVQRPLDVMEPLGWAAGVAAAALLLLWSVPSAFTW